MAGTIVLSDSATNIIRKYTINWTSSVGGAADGTTVVLSGAIERVNFVPDGTDVPTNGYTVTLTDTDGIDVLQGIGALGLSDTVATTAIPMISNNKIVINDALTVTIAGAGNAKKGKISLYISKGGS